MNGCKAVLYVLYVCMTEWLDYSMYVCMYVVTYVLYVYINIRTINMYVCTAIDRRR